jgi:hypothetical protein
MPKAPVIESNVDSRFKAFEVLTSWLRVVPDDWIKPVSKDGDGPEVAQLQSLTCTSYRDLIVTWRKALKWRQDLDDVLGTMLAVAASTVQQGDQLFLMVIGDAGSGKTRLSDAMLVSKHCYPLEHLTGFFSGFKGDDGEDYSLIGRVNGKLMLTPEGDVLMSNPKFPEIMAQQRRIFDGVSGATYKNSKEDKRYSGLRTPWIIAGTPALLDSDQTRLGDRFLKVFVESPSEDQRKEILRRISRSAFEAVQSQASGEDHVGAKLQEAYQRTGGYVDWLRDNTHLLGELVADDDYLDICESLGDFISYLRARPGKSDDAKPTREQPTRLASQMTRLMACQTYVLNKTAVDDEVLRRIIRVALNTASGIGYDIAQIMYKEENVYLPNRTFHVRLDYNKVTIDKQLRLMKQIGAVQLSTEDAAYVQKSAKPYWKLSHRMYELWSKVESLRNSIRVGH